MANVFFLGTTYQTIQYSFQCDCADLIQYNLGTCGPDLFGLIKFHKYRISHWWHQKGFRRLLDQLALSNNCKFSTSNQPSAACNLSPSLPSLHYASEVSTRWVVGLPCLRNLVNVYKSSSNRNDSVYTELPDLIFFHHADR